LSEIAELSSRDLQQALIAAVDDQIQDWSGQFTYGLYLLVENGVRNLKTEAELQRLLRITPTEEFREQQSNEVARLLSLLPEARRREYLYVLERSGNVELLWQEKAFETTIVHLQQIVRYTRETADVTALGDYGELNEQTLLEWLSGLCPIWPFC
jgi:hypothetical protein